jgi:hypothetical protein
MKSTYLTNLLLLVVAVLLVWLMTESKVADSAYITDKVQAAQVNQITIVRLEQQSIHLQRDQQWQLSQPVNVRANQTRINLLLSLLQQPVHQQIPVTQTTDLAEFGLQQPELSLVFNEYQFAFGDTEPLSGYRYILHNEQIYLVNDDISPLLGASASSFVDNRLLDPASNIAALHLPELQNQKVQQQYAALSIVQQNDSWHSNPQNYPQDKLLPLLQNWQQAYAMQVVILSDAATITPDAQPAVTIELTDNTQRNFVVSYSEEGLTLTDHQQQLQYLFPATIIPALFSINE